MVSATEEGKPGGPGGLRIGLGILGAGIAVVVGQALGGALLGALGLPPPPLPEGTDVAGLARVMPLAAAVLALGLTPLALGLRGPAWARFGVLTTLVLLVWGVGTVLDARLLLAGGAGSPSAVGFTLGTAVLPSLGAGGALALLGTGGQLPARRHLGLPAQAGRVAALFLIFPVTYLGFGWIAFELVGSFFRDGGFGLVQPTWAALLPTLTARSALLALAVVGVVRLWEPPGTWLPIALAVGLFVLLGGYHGVMGYWLPASLRLVHALEILGGAVFYAAAAAVLLCVPPPEVA